MFVNKIKHIRGEQLTKLRAKSGRVYKRPILGQSIRQAESRWGAVEAATSWCRCRAGRTGIWEAGEVFL